MTPDLPLATRAPILAAILLLGAIFGFFYAWVCSTMWGLDAADPRVAIEAMQAMNASVRNAVFFPAFFLTPVACGIAALALYTSQERESALWFLAAGLLYTTGGMILTIAVHIPMNEALALVEVPAAQDAASQIWADYSGKWQVWNTARTIVCGAALLLAGIGLLRLGR